MSGLPVGENLVHQESLIGSCTARRRLRHRRLVSFGSFATISAQQDRKFSVLLDTIEGISDGVFEPRDSAEWEFRNIRGFGKCWTHVTSRIRVRPNKHGFWFSISLPSLLHKTNARQLRDQREIDQSLFLLKTILREQAGGEITKITRLDLVVHVDADPEAVTNALRVASHPCFRGSVNTYESSRNFGRSNAARTIRFSGYDKHLESYGTNSNDYRLELQLRSRELCRLSEGLTLTLSEIKYDVCYNVMRNFLSGFDRRIESRATSRLEAVAKAERLCQSHGFSILPILTESMNDDSYARRYRRDVTSLVAQSQGVRFCDLLPDDSETYSASITPHKKRKQA